MKVKIYRDVKGSHLTFCIISNLERIFSALSPNVHTKQLTSNYIP